MSDGPEVALNWLFPDLNFFDSAQCLMVRKWRLIGYFPILYNPNMERSEHSEAWNLNTTCRVARLGPPTHAERAGEWGGVRQCHR